MQSDTIDVSNATEVLDVETQRALFEAALRVWDEYIATLRGGRDLSLGYTSPSPASTLPLRHADSR